MPFRTGISAADVLLIENVALACLAAACAATDLWCGKVFNLVTVPGLLLGILCRASGSGASGILEVLCSAGFTIVFLYPFFRAKGLGAGDIKLLAVVSAFMPPGAYLWCFGGAFLIGAALGIFRLVHSRWTMHRLHFAVPVALSVLLYLTGVYQGISRVFL